MASAEGDTEEEQVEALEETSEDTAVDIPEEEDDEDEIPFDVDEEDTVTLDEAKAKVSAELKSNADFKGKVLAHLKKKGIKSTKNIDEETYMELYSMI